MRTLVASLAVVGVVSFAGLAIAQDKLHLLREANVVATEARVQFEADGGCMFQGVVRGSTDAGMEMVGVGDPAPFNGARCATVRDAALKNGKKALGVGAGGAL